MNPFRSPQFENSSKLLNQLETYHLHQTHLSNKPGSHKMIRSPKNQRVNNVKRIEIISGTGDRRQKLYRKKGARKLVLSEKADKLKKSKQNKVARKHSDNWSKKSLTGKNRELVLRKNKKEKSLRVFQKGQSGSPNFQGKESLGRMNYSIGHHRFLVGRPGQGAKWNREDTLTSQYDLSSEFLHSKENYNMYANTNVQKIPLALSKMRQIVNVQASDRSFLESMRMSRKAKKADEPRSLISHPLVFVKRKQKSKKGLSGVPSKKKVLGNSRNNSSVQNKQKKQSLQPGGKLEVRARKGSALRNLKARANPKTSSSMNKKQKASNKRSKNLAELVKKNNRKINSSRNTKQDYAMDVFVSMTQKKGRKEHYHSEQNKKNASYLSNFERPNPEKDKFRKWSQKEDPTGPVRSKRECLDLQETATKNGAFAKKPAKTTQKKKEPKEKQEVLVLVTESSKETSQHISSQKGSTAEKLKLEDLMEKARETRQLMEIFREQKTGIFDNKRQVEDQINSTFLRLLNQMEQERVRVLKVIEEDFQRQKQSIFEIEKKLTMGEQNMQASLR